jgi:hypothetical protein
MKRPLFGMESGGMEHSHPVGRREDVAEAALPGREHLLVVSAEHGWLRRIGAPRRSPWCLRLVDSRRRELMRCELRSWTGGFDGISVAPDSTVAAVRWNEQTEAGLVLVALAGELRQLSAEWDTRETNWLEGPEWTPDSSLLVLAENPAGAGPWWAAQEPSDADDEDVSPGGRFTAGSLVVLDRDLRERDRQRIAVELPPGWYPSSDADRGLTRLALLSSDEIIVRVPAAGDRRIMLRGLRCPPRF